MEEEEEEMEEIDEKDEKDEEQCQNIEIVDSKNKGSFEGGEDYKKAYSKLMNKIYNETKGHTHLLPKGIFGSKTFDN